MLMSFHQFCLFSDFFLCSHHLTEIRACQTSSAWIMSDIIAMFCILITEGIDIVCTRMGLLPVSLKCDDGGIDIYYVNWGRTVPYVDMCPLFVAPQENTNCYHNVYDNIAVCSGFKQLHMSLHDTYIMMTSSNGNIFRVTGHLCGEFTGPRWIPDTKASDAELWWFLWSAPE